MSSTVRAFVALLALVLASCGGGGNQQAETITPETTPTATADETTDEMAEPADGGGPRDLEAALLTLEDMPAGWTVAADEEVEEDDSTSDLCGRDIRAEFQSVAEAEAEFQKSDFGPFVTHTLARYESGQAQTAMDAFREAAQSCQQWTDQDPELGETTFQLSPLSFPQIGDQTVALRISGENELVTFAGDLVVWRQGDILSLLMNLGTGGDLDSGLTERLAREAAAKI